MQNELKKALCNPKGYCMYVQWHIQGGGGVSNSNIPVWAPKLSAQIEKNRCKKTPSIQSYIQCAYVCTFIDIYFVYKKAHLCTIDVSCI